MSRAHVVLRDERTGSGVRHLEAYLDEDGNLQIEGHDLGPGTAPISDDGEYEWFETVARADLARLVDLLGGQPGEDILDLLRRKYRGSNASKFTEVLHQSDIPVERFSW